MTYNLIRKEVVMLGMLGMLGHSGGCTALANIAFTKVQKGLSSLCVRPSGMLGDRRCPDGPKWDPPGGLKG
jgi:hypothetical protein